MNDANLGELEIMPLHHYGKSTYDTLGEVYDVQ